MAAKIECHKPSNLSATPLNKQQFRLNKINEIKEYFIADIKERELMSKRLSKYIAFFDYFDKSLIVLSATSESILYGIICNSYWDTRRIASASLSLTFSLSMGLVKKLLKITRNKKKSRTKIIVLSRIKLNKIESKISEALINNQISHEDFLTIIDEENNCRKLKESIRMMKGQEDKKIHIDY